MLADNFFSFVASFYAVAVAADLPSCLGRWNHSWGTSQTEVVWLCEPWCTSVSHLT